VENIQYALRQYLLGTFLDNLFLSAVHDGCPKTSKHQRSTDMMLLVAQLIAIGPKQGLIIALQISDTCTLKSIIDCRCEDGRVLASASGVAISNHRFAFQQ
jgi:hypothetical protein